jgi:hypothetical protein
MKRRAIPATAPADAAGRSVIKQKYRERYEDGSCGDCLARKLRKHLEADGGAIDLAKLQQLAERNLGFALRVAEPWGGTHGRRQPAKENWCVPAAPFD